MEVLYNSIGLGNCFNDNQGNKWIELNENLKKYPELHNRILNHETKHYNSDGKLDIGIELKESLGLKDLWFMFKYPKSFLQFLPVYPSKKGITFDWFLILNYSIIGLFLTLFIIGGLI